MIDKIKKIKKYRLLLDFEREFKNSVILRYSLSNRNFFELNYDIIGLCLMYNLDRPIIAYDHKQTYAKFIFDEELIIKIKIRDER